MSYAGDITPTQCWEILSKGTSVFLVDVRTRAEWAFVGTPALEQSMSPMVGQEWQVFPDMAVDPNFGTTLDHRLKELGATQESEVCFLCRSGVRSLSAAQTMSGLGYKNSYNIAGGFEGDPDENGHRGNRNGWKAEKLPWRQG